MAEAEATFEVTKRKITSGVEELESKRKLLTFYNFVHQIYVSTQTHPSKTHFNIENMIYEFSHELQQTRSTKYSKLCV